jgi:hypothetical protein
MLTLQPYEMVPFSCQLYEWENKAIAESSASTRSWITNANVKQQNSTTKKKRGQAT